MRNLIPGFIRKRHQDRQFEGQFKAVSLFVDVSGFTALTELLMAHGKVGAEILTDAINSVFVPLVRCVYEHGGFVSHFAGDSFFALFPTRRTQAPLHAAHTAFFVERFFREHGRIETRYGTISLGAKCGLAVGSVKWGILGRESRYTYYFRGDAIDASAAAEQVAKSGEIIATAAFESTVHSHTRSTRRADFFRLKSLGSPLRKKRYDRSRVHDSDLRPFVHDQVLTVGAQAEFRNVATIFIGIDETADRESFNSFVYDTLRLVASYKGYFNRLMFGDKGCTMLVLFGAPVAYENNVDRGVDFLLALPRNVPWRAGMTFGSVFAGFVGGDERSEYTAMGDTVNLAARLMTATPWGAIWTGRNVADWLAGKGYRLEQVGSIRFKGKKRAVPVSSVLNTPRSLVEAPAFRKVFFGRSAELTKVEETLDSLGAGDFCGLVSVHGEAGVGKSHLLHELRLRMLDRFPMSWLGCRADAVLRLALNPFRELCHRYFEQSPEIPTEENKERFLRILDGLAAHAPDKIRAELKRTHSFLGALIGLRWPDSLYEQVDAGLRHRNTIASLKALFLAESMRRPTVLQIDDLQWLDPESHEFLCSLTRNVDDYPFAVVTTSRYRDDGSHVTLEVDEEIPRLDIDLGCLELSDASFLARDVLQGPVSADLVEFLLEKTGGNPFFTEQLLLDLRERDVLRTDHSSAWSIPAQDMVEIPSTIGAVLVARIDRLTAEIRTIVQTAAVLGQEFEIQVLSEMLKSESEVQTIVRRAEGEAIWSALSEVRYIFRHALLRDAAYDMQLRARLRQLHELAANAMETVFTEDLASYYPDLAFHFRKAEKAEPERHYAQQAGVQAWERSRFREATVFLERALSLSSEKETSRRCEILRALGDIYLNTGKYKRAEERFQLAFVAAERSGDPIAEAHATEALASVAYRRGDVDSARIGYEKSLAAYQALKEDEGIATSLLHLGLVHQRLGDIDRAQELFHESRTLSEQIDCPRSLAVSLNALGELAYRRGRYAEAREIFETCITICREIEDPMRTALALNNLGTVTSEMGEDGAAQKFYTEALQMQREIGDEYGCAGTLNNLAFFPYSNGDLNAAEQLVEESLKIAREIGNLSIAAMNLNNLGMFAELQNDFDKARARFEASLEISRKLGDPQSTALTLCTLASTFLELGEVEQAEETLRESLELAVRAQATPLMLQALLRIGEIYLLRGQTPRSAELVGLVEHHPATEADVRQNIMPGIRAKLEAIMAPDEFAQALERGKASDLSAFVELVLGDELDERMDR